MRIASSVRIVSRVDREYFNFLLHRWLWRRPGLCCTNGAHRTLWFEQRTWCHMVHGAALERSSQKTGDEWQPTTLRESTRASKKRNALENLPEVGQGLGMVVPSFFSVWYAWSWVTGPKTMSAETIYWRKTRRKKKRKCYKTEPTRIWVERHNCTVFHVVELNGNLATVHMR